MSAKKSGIIEEDNIMSIQRDHQLLFVSFCNNMVGGLNLYFIYHPHFKNIIFLYQESIENFKGRYEQRDNKKFYETTIADFFLENNNIQSEKEIQTYFENIYNSRINLVNITKNSIHYYGFGYSFKVDNLFKIKGIKKSLKKIAFEEVAPIYSPIGDSRYRLHLSLDLNIKDIYESKSIIKINRKDVDKIIRQDLKKFTITNYLLNKFFYILNKIYYFNSKQLPDQN